MKKISSMTELHEILLNLAKEFHRICVENNIPYYMLGGSMLGAIRHRGFIPWDDDMDFGIPRIYYHKFIEVCNQQLRLPYRFIYLSNSDYAILGIGKLMDERTVLKEVFSMKGDEEIGVNIDIFPLDKTNNNTSIMSRNRLLRGLFKFQKILFVNSNDRPFIKRLLSRSIQILFPLNKSTLLSYMEKIALKHYSDNDSTMYFNVCGAWGFKELISTDIFGKPTLYKFEDIQLFGVENYDSYLARLYNNYMQLPPLEKQHIHSLNIYIK